MRQHSSLLQLLFLVYYRVIVHVIQVTSKKANYILEKIERII
jgi:hypothetical protein